MLPFAVEYELMVWFDITGNIQVFVVVLFILYVARKSDDETWIR